MFKEFEVTWSDGFDTTPEQVWDAITVHSAGWLWPVSYEPRVGGAETGLSPAGGRVTAWDPARRFATRAESDDGWWNEILYELAPDGAGTAVRFRHRSVMPADEYDLQLDQCERHTDFYRHTMAEYLRHFAGRDATYLSVDVPGRFADVSAQLEEAGPVVDHRCDAFLGMRTDNALIRVFGRDAWGGSVAVTTHVFAPEAV